MTTTIWRLDETHAEVRFRIRHLMVSWVSGSFKRFGVTLETEGQDIRTARVRFSAETASIDTGNEKRDDHLRSADFFDSANLPELRFECDSLRLIREEEYEAEGILSIRGISRPIRLQVEFGGIIKDPRGDTRMGVTLSGKVDRGDYGLTFSRLSETGETLLGNSVQISASAEFVAVIPGGR